MKVYIPTHLRSYTGKRAVVDGSGGTLRELLAELNRRYPGFEFRIVNEQDEIREHIRIFVNQDQARNLAVPLRSSDEIWVVAALSGG